LPPAAAMRLMPTGQSTNKPRSPSSRFLRAPSETCAGSTLVGRRMRECNKRCNRSPTSDAQSCRRHAPRVEKMARRAAMQMPNDVPRFLTRSVRATINRMSHHAELYNAVVDARIDVHEWLMILRVRPDAG